MRIKGNYRMSYNPRQKMNGFVRVIILLALLAIAGCIIFVMMKDNPANQNNPNSPDGSVSMLEMENNESSGISDLESTDENSLAQEDNVISQEENGDETSQPTQTSETTPIEPPAGTVEYTGQIEHIFVHPLVAYPELAFDGDSEAKGMDDFMTTATEFKRILEQCYKNNYILVNIEKCFGYVDVDGNQEYRRLPLYLPAGKKPLIISTDDMNYYKYMMGNGCNYKVVIGPDGNIAMYSKDPNGNDVISYDTEVMPIVDSFVKEHPDFSHEGAKGIVGVTGYDGVLGYRTNRANTTNRDSEIAAVKPIIERLKETGWTFASHSYGHPNMKNISLSSLKEDTDHFNNEVVPLIGKTEIFLYPYGAWPSVEDTDGKEKLDYLIDVGGFRHFSGVGRMTYERNFNGRYVFDDRKNIDGIVLRNYGHQISDLMDADYVIDLQARGSEPGKGIGVK